MKTPAEIAAQIINENYEDQGAPHEYPATENLNYLLQHGEVDADGIEALLIAAIEADRAQRVERDRAHHVKHEPRDWFTRGVYPWCSCGYVPLNNADLTDHWHENGIEWVDEHGRLVSRPYENKED